MVDRVLLESILADIRANVQVLRQSDDIDLAKYRQDTRTRRFVERTLHILVEACVDAAHHIISDENLREPKSYRDSFTVLAETGIISREHLSVYEQMTAFRNLIVHYYERIDSFPSASPRLRG